MDDILSFQISDRKTKMEKRGSKSEHKIRKKSEQELINELKKKIKHQKDALTKIIKTYRHEK